MDSEKYSEIIAPITDALVTYIKEMTGLKFSVFIKPDAFCDPSVEFICTDETDELQALVAKMLLFTSKDGSYYKKTTIDDVLRILKSMAKKQDLENLTKVIDLARKFTTAINIARQYCSNINYLINNLKEYKHELQSNN